MQLSRSATRWLSRVAILWLPSKQSWLEVDVRILLGANRGEVFEVTKRHCGHTDLTCPKRDFIEPVPLIAGAADGTPLGAAMAEDTFWKQNVYFRVFSGMKMPDNVWFAQ